MNIFYLLIIVSFILFFWILYIVNRKYKGRKKNLRVWLDFYPMILFPILLYLLLLVLIPSIYPHNDEADRILILRVLYYIYDSSLLLYYGLSTLITAFALAFVTKGTLSLNEFSKDKSIPLFEGFVSDASHLYVFGKNLNFLSSSKYQETIIKKLSNRCSIICTKPDSAEIKVKYKELLDNGCNLRVIDEIDYRGQIKLDSTQNYKACVVEKRKDKYVVLDMQSDSLVNVMLNKVKDLYENGYSPFPKVIVIDVGGVYFDGDYHTDFCDVIMDKYNINLRKRKQDKQLLDQDLNQGNIDIIQYIERETGKSINNDIKKKIRELWNTVWKPNDQFRILVDELKKNGYIVCFFSNIDAENGAIYDTNGYFPTDTKQYFSYETKLLIPDEEAYENLMTKENVKGQEILFIDDQMTNIDVAKNLNWNCIHYINSEGDKFDRLIKKLQESDVFIDYGIFK